MNNFIEIEIKKIIQKFYKDKDLYKLKIKDNGAIIYVILEELPLKLHNILKKNIQDYAIKTIPNKKVEIIFSNSKDSLPENKTRLAKKVILVTSCKGGVGKSTISSLIAQKLAQKEYRKNVGLVDADIYGPSIHKIFSIEQKPIIKEGMIQPILKYGVLINSIGTMINDSTALSIRAPIVNKTLFKLMSLTNWGTLDFLIIDTPPGTGDIHLSILQNYSIDYAVLVTTPQKISGINTLRTLNLLEKFSICIKLVVENMSYLEIDNQKLNIFKSNGTQELANRCKLKTFEKFPIIPELSAYCDSGQILKKFFKFLKLENVSIFH